LLRRPFSLAARRDTPDAAELDILYRTVGTGTAWMARLLTADSVHLIGPLGNHFTPPPPNGLAILVGGGVGIPPMLYLASTLANQHAIFFAGATTRDLLPLTITADAPTPFPNSIDPLYNIAELAQYNIPAVITTDDGSWAFHGLVTQALEQYLDRFFHTRDPGPGTRNPTIYCCGPEPMMKRVADIAIRRGIDCQISVERAMACGMGTCQSCVIRVKKPDPAKPPLAGKDSCYRLACTDGPIFHAADLLW
jgi:dihydroorotate dehydrogenase electron transfer subunit